MYQLTNINTILRDDGAFIPADAKNSDYRAYMLWIEKGNTPTPADVPDPKVAILADIDQRERATMLPRAVREFMLGYMAANYTAAQLAANPGYVKIKAFDDQIAVLRAATK